VLNSPDKTQQEQQRVAVGPVNAHFISIRQVSSDAATLRAPHVRPAPHVLPAPLLLQLLLAASTLLMLLCVANSIW